jgi:hypothetical protein
MGTVCSSSGEAPVALLLDARVDKEDSDWRRRRFFVLTIVGTVSMFVSVFSPTTRRVDPKESVTRREDVLNWNSIPQGPGSTGSTGTTTTQSTQAAAVCQQQQQPVFIRMTRQRRT